MEQVKEALSDSEKFFWYVLDATDDAVLITDDNGFLSYVSPNTAELFALRVEEVRQMVNISALVGEALFDLGELKRVGTLRNLELAVNTNRGEMRTLQINVRSVDLREGTILYCCRDITEVKQAAQIVQDLERMKIEFIVMAGHELRTPLSVVQGYADLLLQQPDLDAESRRRCLSIIFEQAQELTKITNDLLYLSCGREIRGPSPRKSVAYAKHLVGRIISKICHKIPAYRLEERMPESPACLWVDQDGIERLLEILLEHTFKNSPLEGKIVLCGQKRGRDFAFLIASEAVEMSWGEQHKVFDRFYRTDALNTRLPELDFGISVAKKIVEEHGGRLRYESTPDQGARFFFALPLAEEIRTHG